MIKIFLDFDDVLFNTRDFVADYKKIFYKFGVSEALFKKYYYGYSISQNGHLVKYDPFRHLKALEEKEGKKVLEIKKEVNKFIKDTSQYVFPDVLDFLETFPKKNLLLLSYGETKFQNMKIKNSGLAKYFSEIIVGDKLKSEMIAKFLKKRGEYYFLEDRAMQITDVEKNFPFVKTILIKRKERRYKDRKNKYCEFTAKNLAEVKKIIMN